MKALFCALVIACTAQVAQAAENCGLTTTMCCAGGCGANNMGCATGTGNHAGPCTPEELKMPIDKAAPGGTPTTRPTTTAPDKATKAK